MGLKYKVIGCKVVVQQYIEVYYIDQSVLSLDITVSGIAQ